MKLLNKLALNEFRGLRYSLAVVCPFSTGEYPDFIRFDTLDTSLENKRCIDGCSFSGHPADFDSNRDVYKWVTTGFADEAKHALHPDGTLLFL